MCWTRLRVFFSFTPLKIINADFSRRVQIHKDLHNYVPQNQLIDLFFPPKTRQQYHNFFSGAYEREGAEKYERGISTRHRTLKLSLRRSAFMIFKGVKMSIRFLVT